MKQIYTQQLGQHSWTDVMDNIAAICGECPECMTPAEPEHTEFSGGDGERGYVEYDCSSCGASWTDEFRLVTRTVYLARKTAAGPSDDRETIWIDGVEQDLYSVAEGLEIMARIHAETTAREAV